MTNYSEIYSDGEKYISSKRASALTGYAKDYIGQLCRLEKIRCQRSGRDWLVSEQSILSYKERAIPNNNLNKRIQSYDAQIIKPYRQSHTVSRESQFNELGIKGLAIIFEALLVSGLIIWNPAGTLPALQKAGGMGKNILNSTHFLNSTVLASFMKGS